MFVYTFQLLNVVLLVGAFCGICFIIRFVIVTFCLFNVLKLSYFHLYLFIYFFKTGLTSEVHGYCGYQLTEAGISDDQEKPIANPVTNQDETSGRNRDNSSIREDLQVHWK